MHPRLSGFALAFMLLVSVAGAASVSNPARVSALSADERLDKKLVLLTTTISLAQAIEAVQLQTGAHLMVQGDLLKRPLVLRQPERPARAILEDLATLFGGTWVKRSNGYLLVTDEVAAGLIGKKPVGDTSRHERALFLSLTLSQMRALESRKVLSWGDLTPQQQRLARLLLSDRFLREPDRYPSSIVTGEGVTISIPQIRDSPWPIMLRAPALEGDEFLSRATIAEVWTSDGRTILP